MSLVAILRVVGCLNVERLSSTVRARPQVDPRLLLLPAKAPRGEGEAEPWPLAD